MQNEGENLTNPWWMKYLQYGLSVFPVQPMSKTPAIKWETYQKRLPKKNEVEEWAQTNNNIAIVCGSVSDNLVVIDFDNPEFFRVFFPKIFDENGVGKTWIVETPRPGIHVYFRTNKPVRSRRYVDAKIDIKGEGGYVLAPPSIHPNGGQYRFLAGPEQGVDIQIIDEENFFDLIEKRLAELGFKSRHTEELTEEAKDITIGDPPWVRKMLEGVPEGERDECAIRLASYYLNVRRLTPQAVEGILLNWNLKNKPPMENAAEWVRIKVASALRGGYVYSMSDPLIRKYSGPSEDDAILAKAAEYLRGNLVAHLMNHARKKVLEDDNVLRIMLLIAATSWVKKSANVFVRGPPSIGKTYVTVHALRYFPNVVLLMGMSPKTIVHEYSYFSKDEQAFIVDLWNKVLVFLEEPSQAVYEILRPLMSHDKEEVEYKWVELRRNRQKTVRSLIRGWPAFIFLGTTSKLLEDLASRGVHLTPRMTSSKWIASLNLRGEEFSYPFKFLEDTDEEFKALRMAVKMVYDFVTTKRADVVIPFAEAIADILKNTSIGKTPRASRDITTLFSLISGSAALNSMNRPILRINKGDIWVDYIIATHEDMANVIEYWLDAIPASISGVNRTQYDVFQLIRNLPMDRELTTRYIYSEWRRQYPDKPLTYETMRKYLHTLEDVGLLVSEKSGNQNRYWVADYITDLGNDDALKLKSVMTEEWLIKWFEKVKSMGTNAYIVYPDGECLHLDAIGEEERDKLLKVIRGNGEKNELQS